MSSKSQKDVFEVSGPIHLTSVNWNCPHHRRSVAASLVQGAYALERDRQKNRRGAEACAPPWWERFNFEVTRKLIDDADGSIFGAIYEFKPPEKNLHSPTVPSTPRFVIAFRGTVMKKKSGLRDLMLDGKIVTNSLHKSSRFTIAMKAVRSLVETSGHEAVWLAGHSLGASIATLAGKAMAMEGKHLTTFLFNPPFVSAPIESIEDMTVKLSLLFAKSFIIAGITLAAKAFSDQESNSDPDSFTVLSTWLPSLFVNKSDDICSAYIGYFEGRKKMGLFGLGSVAKLAAENSLKDLLLSGFEVEAESLHLLPSANLTVNPSSCFKSAHGISQWSRFRSAHGISQWSRFRSAHGISQWWRADLDLQPEVYRYE